MGQLKYLDSKGNLINLKDVTVPHIENAIAKLEREGRQSSFEHAVLKAMKLYHVKELDDMPVMDEDVDNYEFTSHAPEDEDDDDDNF